MVDYSDRFLGNTYASDEPVRFTVTLSGRADRVSVDVPESLFVRAQTIRLRIWTPSLTND